MSAQAGLSVGLSVGVNNVFLPLWETGPDAELSIHFGLFLLGPFKKKRLKFHGGDIHPAVGLRE